jgi:hypothetical protein
VFDIGNCFIVKDSKGFKEIARVVKVDKTGIYLITETPADQPQDSKEIVEQKTQFLLRIRPEHQRLLNLLEL